MPRNWKSRLAIFGAVLLTMALFPGVISADSNRKPVKIPPGAKQVAQGVFYLGKAKDRGKTVEGYAFVHPRRPNAKPDGKGKKPGGGGKESCYTFLAKGARWKSTEAYVLDTGNNGGLSEASVTALTAGSLGSWDNQVGFEIFGGEDTVATVDGPDWNSLDGKNEVMVADIQEPGVIAVTIVWGVFGGPPPGRYLAEWDAVFDDADFDWSLTGEAGKMDYQNIATHEFGHAAGLGHPADTCTEETMYAYADFGETKKIDLNSGDIAGITELYK